ncbi:hypothetical protein GYMLUDRAFT_41047 [Collybiopsis luxurians FD-317 M1]|uniref:Uncharacterized protein n=1 Tax=Collybiopsis luxurians FD-317 M1 TaxID=944289 RepID=A0A0D0D290_9AGAR|nr:hypothetical protein GYMLUDRAFT_41047 [Collybiopsis luxurians FD-317 M1]
MFSGKNWIVSFAVIGLAIYAWSDVRHPILSHFQHLFSNAQATSSASPVATPVTVQTNCSSPPDPPHSCVFYAACLEPHFHCGPDGYPLGFGEKFCTKFSLPGNVGRLLDKGQEWMWDTMACLQRALVPELEEPVPPGSSSSQSEACKTLETKAFSTHAPCYLSSGLCSLSPKDWAVIVEIIGVKTLLKSWEAFEGAIEAGEGCLEFFVEALEKDATKEL